MKNDTDFAAQAEEARARLIAANKERTMSLPEGYIEGEFSKADDPPAGAVRDADNTDTPVSQ